MAPFKYDEQTGQDSLIPDSFSDTVPPKEDQFGFPWDEQDGEESKDEMNRKFEKFTKWGLAAFIIYLLVSLVSVALSLYQPWKP